MARTADEVIVEVRAKIDQAERNLGRYARVAEDSFQRSTHAARLHEAQIRRSSGAISSSLKRVAATLAAGVSVDAVTAYADSYTKLQNRLRVVGLEGRALLAVQDQLYEVANRNGVAVGDLAQLYSRVALNNQTLNASQTELLTVTEAVAAALRVQGLSALEAREPLLQLAQTLGSDIARAEEYNSVIEGIPALAQAVARGLGVQTSELGRLVRDGKVTTEAYFRALLKGSEQLIQQSQKANLTIGQSLTVLNNELGRYIGQTDDSLSATERMSQAIIALAENLDRIIPAITVLAALVGTKMAAALVMSTARTVAEALAKQRAAIQTVAYSQALAANSGMLNANAIAAQRAAAATTGAAGAARVAGGVMMTALGGPVGVVALLATGLIGLASHFGSTARAARELDRVTAAADVALEDYRKAVDAARNASKEEREELEKKAAALRDVTQARIEDARVAAQKQIDEAVAARDRAAADRDYANRTAQGYGNGPFSEGRSAIMAGSQFAAASSERYAQRAKDEADEAIAAWRRLEAARDEIENPRTNTGGGGGGSDTAAERRRRENDAKRRAELRAELDLEERLARARATGDEAKIKAEEERQRLLHETARYREAGYGDEDAAKRAQALIDLDKQALQIEEDRVRNADLMRAKEEGLEDARRRSLEWTERQARVEMDLARASGDYARLEALEREAALRQRIAEYVERYGIAGYGMAVAEQARFDQADAEGRQIETARTAARHFVDVLASDNIWEAAGRKFRDAAFDHLEDVFANLFKMLSDRGGGNILSGIGSVVSGVFGGFRANGGPVSAGQAYVVGEKRAEVFVPNVSGTIIPSVNAAAKALASGRAAPAPQPVVFDLRGAVLTQDLVNQMNAIGQAAQAGAVRQAATLSRKSLPGALERQRRLGTV